MASAVADRLSRPSTPRGIEADLSALWRDIGERGPIARAMMSNLVVFRRSHRAMRADANIADVLGDLPVDAVAAQHPCRVIVIDHEQTASESGDATTVGVAIVTFGPPQARYGIEQIAMRAVCPAASLPSIVRRLTRGDLPTSVWWADDVSRFAPPAEIMTIGRQFVYDSRQWRDVHRGVLALAPYITDRPERDRAARRSIVLTHDVDLVDMNWRRLAPIRRAVVVAAAAQKDSAAWQPADLRIIHRPGDGALAWLLVGWLTSRLGWPANVQPHIEEAPRGDAVLSVVIGGGAQETRVTLDRGRVLVTHTSGAPSMIGAPREGEADAVAAELHALSHDACLHDALSALLRAFSAA